MRLPRSVAPARPLALCLPALCPLALLLGIALDGAAFPAAAMPRSAHGAVSAHAPAPGAASEPAIAAAIARPGRPESATALDEGRKPAAVLAFLGLRPGMQAADLMTGGGYWAEIMARITGPRGHVTAYEATQFYGDKAKAGWQALLARQKGISLIAYPFETFSAPPATLDFAIANLNYHDLYWESEKFGIHRTDPAAFVRTLYAAMKPGGIVGVIDHVALPGDTRATAGALHRIDPATVRADFERAGFVLEAESDLLRNPADDHRQGVFDPAIRGKTDRFLMKFRKPR